MLCSSLRLNLGSASQAPARSAYQIWAARHQERVCCRLSALRRKSLRHEPTLGPVRQLHGTSNSQMQKKASSRTSRLALYCLHRYIVLELHRQCNVCLVSSRKRSSFAERMRQHLCAGQFSRCSLQNGLVVDDPREAHGASVVVVRIRHTRSSRTSRSKPWGWRRCQWLSHRCEKVILLSPNNVTVCRTAVVMWRRLS